MTALIDALVTARLALDSAGFPEAEVAITLSAKDALVAQREFAVVTAIIEESLRARDRKAELPNRRLLGIVGTIPVYVFEAA